MPKSIFASALALVLVAGAAQAAAPPKQLITVRNDASRIVECAVVVDGHARTTLKIRPTKLWSDLFDPRQDVRLVCERAAKMFYGPLKAGMTYRLVDGEKRVDLAEGVGE